MIGPIRNAYTRSCGIRKTYGRVYRYGMYNVYTMYAIYYIMLMDYYVNDIRYLVMC